MATTQRSAHHPARSGPPTEAEDAARALALIVALVCGLTLFTLLLIEVMEALPGGVGFVAFISVAVFTAVVAWALVSRALSTPTVYRSHTPTLRHLHR